MWFKTWLKNACEKLLPFGKKACCLRAILLQSVIWKMLIIVSFIKHFSWSSPKYWIYYLLKFCSVRCLTLSFLVHRPIYRVLIERNYWLIKMDIRKSLQASSLSFISPKLVGKAVLQFMLIMLHYTNSALW